MHPTATSPFLTPTATKRSRSLSPNNQPTFSLSNPTTSSSTSSFSPPSTKEVAISTFTPSSPPSPTRSVPVIRPPPLSSSSFSSPPSIENEEVGQIPKAIRLSPAVDLKNLNFNINSPPKHRPVRIYCDGIYDLFHYGHARCLEQAKTAFPNVYLLVGVCNDQITHARKGKTVMTDIERFESLRHCKWVDEVIENAPWIIDQEFLDHHEIDYVAHDNIPYTSGEIEDVYDFVKKQGRFLPTRRTEGISTSDLITRIVRDYDEYLRRNLSRGVSARDLNIGFFKEKRLQVAQSVQEIKDEIKSELAELKDEWKEMYKTWETKSSHYVKGFVELFKHGPDLVVKFLRMKSPVHDTTLSPPSQKQKKRKNNGEENYDDNAEELSFNNDSEIEDTGESESDLDEFIEKGTEKRNTKRVRRN